MVGRLVKGQRVGACSAVIDLWWNNRKKNVNLGIVWGVAKHLQRHSSCCGCRIISTHNGLKSGIESRGTSDDSVLSHLMKVDMHGQMMPNNKLSWENEIYGDRFSKAYGMVYVVSFSNLACGGDKRTIPNDNSGHSCRLVAISEVGLP